MWVVVKKISKFIFPPKFGDISLDGYQVFRDKGSLCAKVKKSPESISVRDVSEESTIISENIVLCNSRKRRVYLSSKIKKNYCEIHIRNGSWWEYQVKSYSRQRSGRSRASLLF